MKRLTVKIFSWLKNVGSFDDSNRVNEEPQVRLLNDYDKKAD